MGYYTDFRVSYVAPKDFEFPFETLEIGGYTFEDGWDFSGWYMNGKWYDWSSDMARFSMEYPDVLFIIEGRGEEGNDIWCALVKNGHVSEYQAEVRYPLPDVYDDVELPRRLFKNQGGR